MVLLPRRRAYIAPVNVDFRCMIIALHFSGCSTNKFLSQHSWSSARTLFSGFVRKIHSFCDTVLLCRLHTHTFPQSVVILGGRL